MHEVIDSYGDEIDQCDSKPILKITNQKFDDVATNDYLCPKNESLDANTKLDSEYGNPHHHHHHPHQSILDADVFDDNNDQLLMELNRIGINERWWNEKRAKNEQEKEMDKIVVDKFRTIKQNIKRGNTRSLLERFENLIFIILCESHIFWRSNHKMRKSRLSGGKKLQALLKASV
ncbi:hypothetical protein SSS_00035 [Sarcoptes scabiei]|uniref:Uncharacterized protein n=1 Tax=Sarcoptes scabiei TaxID=52283 RepID=A0A834VA85_SARSC|nr:hypothetical protein SSS_00035 [Sarcoptes scabiei]